MSQIETIATFDELITVEELEQKTAPDASGMWSTVPN